MRDGSITSTKGTVGGFTISATSIESTSADSKQSMYLSTGVCLITDTATTGETYTAAFGPGSVASIAGFTGLMWLSAKKTNTTYFSDLAVGGAISVSGFYENRALDISAKGGTENYAIYCSDGMYAGFRPNARTINTSSPVTLTQFDNTIVNTNSSSDTTISLPTQANEKIGQTFLIMNTVQKKITIKPRSGAWIKCNGYTYTYSSPMITGSEELMIILVCTGPGA